MCFALGPSQIVNTSAFLSQSIQRERENWDNYNRITIILFNRVVSARNGGHFLLGKNSYGRITSTRTSKEKWLQEYIIKFKGEK